MQLDGCWKNMDPLLLRPFRVTSHPWLHKDREQRAPGPFRRGISGQDYPRTPGPNKQLHSFGNLHHLCSLPSRAGERDPNKCVCTVLLNRILCNTEGSDYADDPS